jgi:hypothetical protein
MKIIMGSFITLLIISIVLFWSQPCFLQEEPRESKENEEFDASFNASFEYQELGSNWHWRYYGLFLEAYVNNTFSLSGQVYAGNGSDGKTYVHIPAGGLLLLLTTKTVLDVLFEDEPLTTMETIILILTENINYNMYYANNKISVSPYLNIFALDASEAYGPDRTQNAMLSNGLGVNVKFMHAKPLIVSTFFNLKYYHVVGGNFSFNNHFGYAVGINAGIIY